LFNISAEASGDNRNKEMMASITKMDNYLDVYKRRWNS